MSGRFERKPLRDWERGESRRSPSQQIGAFRLLGFLAILVGSFVVIRGFGEDQRTQPRIAADGIVAAPIKSAIPDARIARGSSAVLAGRLRDGLRVDLVIVDRPTAEALVRGGQCETGGTVIASRGATPFVACTSTSRGASEDLARAAISELQRLQSRDLLLGAGLDVPQPTG